VLFQVSRDAGSLSSVVDSLSQVWGCACSSSGLAFHLSIQQRRLIFTTTSTPPYELQPA